MEMAVACERGRSAGRRRGGGGGGERFAWRPELWGRRPAKRRKAQKSRQARAHHNEEDLEFGGARSYKHELKQHNVAQQDHCVGVVEYVGRETRRTTRSGIRSENLISLLPLQARDALRNHWMCWILFNASAVRAVVVTPSCCSDCTANSPSLKVRSPCETTGGRPGRSSAPTMPLGKEAKSLLVLWRDGGPRDRLISREL